jgi:hypothetical protein
MRAPAFFPRRSVARRSALTSRLLDASPPSALRGGGNFGTQTFHLANKPQDHLRNNLNATANILTGAKVRHVLQDLQLLIAHGLRHVCAHGSASRVCAT